MKPPNERELAEEAFAAFDSDDPSSEPEWPPVAGRIRDARNDLGLAAAHVAERAGLSSGTYWHAENDDEETFTVLSIAEIVRLGKALGLPPGKLLFGQSGPEVQEVTFAELAERIRDRQAGSGLSVEAFGEEIGWDVSDVLSSSEALWDFGLVGFRDVAKAVGVEWIRALPDQRSSPPPPEATPSQPR